MVDPLSLIAAGAAVGGLASKVAEKAWDSGERWLREKFGSHADEAQEQARENAAKFVHQLAVRVAVLEKQRELDQVKIADAQRHPQFSALLQQTILNAAKTKDDDKLDLLARLVATRLTANAETTFALASDLASDAIARSTRRQLELMALCCFLDEIRPRTQFRPQPITTNGSESTSIHSGISSLLNWTLVISLPSHALATIPRRVAVYLVFSSSKQGHALSKNSMTTILDIFLSSTFYRSAGILGWLACN